MIWFKLRADPAIVVSVKMPTEQPVYMVQKDIKEMRRHCMATAKNWVTA